MRETGCWFGFIFEVISENLQIQHKNIIRTWILLVAMQRVEKMKAMVTIKCIANQKKKFL